MAWHVVLWTLDSHYYYQLWLVFPKIWIVKLHNYGHSAKEAAANIVGHPQWCRLNLHNTPGMLLSSHKVSQFLFSSIPHEVYPPKSLLVGKSWQTKKKISEIKLDNKFCSMKLCKWIFCKRGSSQHWRSSTTGRSNLHNAPELLLLLPKKHNDS